VKKKITSNYLIGDFSGSLQAPFSLGSCHEPGLKASSKEPPLPRQLRRIVVDRFEKSLRHNIDRFGIWRFDSSGRRRRPA
jgi:hypothetical protein